MEGFRGRPRRGIAVYRGYKTERSNINNGRERLALRNKVKEEISTLRCTGG